MSATSDLRKLIRLRDAVADVHAELAQMRVDVEQLRRDIRDGHVRCAPEVPS